MTNGMPEVRQEEELQKVRCSAQTWWQCSCRWRWHGSWSCTVCQFKTDGIAAALICAYAAAGVIDARLPCACIAGLQGCKVLSVEPHCPIKHRPVGITIMDKALPAWHLSTSGSGAAC